MLASIGQIVLDLTIAPQGELNLDDDQEASITMTGGGQAANWCAWAASMGERVRLVTRVGGDDLGRRLVAEIEAAGVEVCAVAGDEPTGAIAVLLGPDGQRTFARQPGASTGLRAEELQEEWFDGVRLLHVPGYSLYQDPLSTAARRAIDLVRAAGGLISIDLSSPVGVRQYGGARLAYDLAVLRPEVLFATEAEAAELGVPLEGLAKVPILKYGGRGVRVFTRVVPAPVVEVVDGNGAGDAFAAAFCAAYIDGATPLEAAGRAILVSARAVGKPGARP
jgi:sugar/nucleoside kinase (ribokinase family)